MEHYILDDNNEIVACDITSWMKSLRSNKVVARTEITPDIIVSTVFLGVNYGSSQFIQTFETMVFSVDSKIEKRYATWTEAEAGHWKIVDKITDEIAIKIWIA